MKRRVSQRRFGICSSATPPRAKLQNKCLSQQCFSLFLSFTTPPPRPCAVLIYARLQMIRENEVRRSRARVHKIMRVRGQRYSNPRLNPSAACNLAHGVHHQPRHTSTRCILYTVYSRVSQPLEKEKRASAPGALLPLKLAETKLCPTLSYLFVDNPQVLERLVCVGHLRLPSTGRRHLFCAQVDKLKFFLFFCDKNTKREQNARRTKFVSSIIFFFNKICARIYLVYIYVYIYTICYVYVVVLV